MWVRVPQCKDKISPKIFIIDKSFPVSLPASLLWWGSDKWFPERPTKVLEGNRMGNFTVVSLVNGKIYIFVWVSLPNCNLRVGRPMRGRLMRLGVMRLGVMRLGVMRQCLMTLGVRGNRGLARD